MTFDEHAQQYADRLNEAQDPKAEATTIANEISSLRYKGSGKPLSDADKEKITQLIGTKRPTTQQQEGEIGIIKEADNKRYLDVARALRDLLGKR